MKTEISARSTGSFGTFSVGHFPNPLFLILTMVVSMGIGLVFWVSPIYGLLAAVVLTLTVLALIRPILLGYLVIAGIALTSGMQRGMIIPFLIPNEAILFFSVALALPYIFVMQFRVIKLATSLNIGIFILVAGTMILPLAAYYFRGITLDVSEIIRIGGPLQYILLYFLFLYIPGNDADCLGLLRFMWACAAVVAVVGLVQVTNFAPLISFLNMWYPSSHTAAAAQAERVTSLLGVWNGLGTFLMTNLLILRAFQPSFQARSEKILAVVVFLLCIGCLVATASYASLIGLVLGIFIIGYLGGRGLKEILTVFSLLILAAIPLQNTIINRFRYQFGEGGLLPHTFQFRLYVWTDIFWPVVQKNWLWGYRPSISDLVWPYAESIYFAIMLSSGIFALLAHFAWLLISLVWLFKRAASSNALVRGLSTSLFALLVVLSIMGITNEVFTFSGTADYMWIMFGLVAGREQTNS